MTYLSVDYFIIKIVLFQIMLNIIYIYINTILIYVYISIYNAMLFSPFRLITTQLNYYQKPAPMYTMVHVGLLLFMLPDQLSPEGTRLMAN